MVKYILNIYRKHTMILIGLLVYVGLWLFTIIGSMVLPFKTMDHEAIMANLSPSQRYLSYPSNMNVQEIKTIVSGTSFSIALMEDGSISSWGGSEFDHKKLKEVFQNKKVSAIAAGAKHVVIADEEANLYEIGDLPYTQRTLTEKEKTVIKEEGIQLLYASDTYSVCLSKEGTLFYWGNTTAIALGELPSAHQGHIKNIAINPFHILYLLDDGTLHMLGRGDRLSEIPQEFQNGTNSILDMELSSTVAMVLDTNHKLHMWGENGYEIPVSDKLVVDITGGYNSFHLLYEDGKVESVNEQYHTEEVTTLFSGYFQTYALHKDKIEAWGNKGFLLGSDEYGRDILTRLAHGGFLSLIIGVPACIFSCLLSIVFGLYSGYYGGKVDHFIMRLSECIASIPFLPLVVSVSAFLMRDSSAYMRIIIVMILYGILSWTSLARLIRNKVWIEKEKDYILYEVVAGASKRRIIWKHIFPSTFSVISADITALYASTLLIEASLSFLGFGVPALYPSWGNMLQNAQTIQVLQRYWWRWLFAAVCIFMSVLSVHLISEGIRKKVNPKE